MRPTQGRIRGVQGRGDPTHTRLRGAALAIAATVVTGVLLAAASPESTARAGTPRARPNVLWFISDDLSPYLGAYGDPLARTPTIDKLAAEGIRFDVVYSDAPVCAPSRFALITGLFSATAGPAHHMRATARIPSFIRGWPELLRQAGYYTTNNFKTDYNADIDLAATWDESSARAHWRNRPAGTPFFAQFTSLTTHESSVFSQQPGQTRPEDVGIPPFCPDTPATRIDKAQYYDRIARMDAELGQLLAQLEADGLADDTIVFYFSDNGGVLPWSKRFANDRGLRVPLIVRIPEKWKHLAPARRGSVVDKPINFTDFSATVLRLAGIRSPRYMQGTPFLGRSRPKRTYAYGQRSRMDERYDLQRSVRDDRHLYIRNYMPHRPYGQHVAFMWGQQGYREWERRHLGGALAPSQDGFWQEKPAEELYDLRTDPDQLHNLSSAAGSQKVLRRLRRVLDEHMLAINDNGFIPEGSPLEGYEESRVRGAYPLRRVMRVAERAIARNPANREVLIEALRDDNEVIRYWAVQGIIMLGSAGSPAAPALAQRVATDPSVQVRVAAAEALTRFGDMGAPVAFLAETLDTHTDRRVQLQALNSLTYVPPAALQPYRDVVERAAVRSDEYVASAGKYLRAVLAGTYDPLTPP